MRTHHLPLFALFALLLLPATAVAQQHDENVIGVSAGVNLTDFQSPDRRLDDATGTDVGVRAGLHGTFPVAGPLKVRTGLHYSERGARMRAELGQEPEMLDIDRAGVEVPVLAVYSLRGEDYSDNYLRLMAGPTVRAGFDCDVAREQNPGIACGDDRLNFEPRTVSVLGTAAVEGGVYVGRGHLTATVRYERGLTDLSTQWADDLRHEGVAVEVGYELPVRFD